MAKYPIMMQEFFDDAVPDRSLLDASVVKTFATRSHVLPMFENKWFDFESPQWPDICCQSGSTSTAVGQVKEPASAETVAFDAPLEDFTCRHSVELLDEEDLSCARQDLIDEQGEVFNASRGMCTSPRVDQNTPAAIKAYMLEHCGIMGCDLKKTAIMRMIDLHSFFHRLQESGVVRLNPGGAGCINSVFGFATLTVHEIGDFNETLKRMIDEDKNGCWHANGRRTFTQPTNTVYELLRQLGVHPVKGSRAQRFPITESRDFMVYNEYVFDLARLRNNCNRLKIGAIGNRR